MRPFQACRHLVDKQLRWNLQIRRQIRIPRFGARYDRHEACPASPLPPSRSFSPARPNSTGGISPGCEASHKRAIAKTINPAADTVDNISPPVGSRDLETRREASQGIKRRNVQDSKTELRESGDTDEDSRTREDRPFSHALPPYFVHCYVFGIMLLVIDV